MMQPRVSIITVDFNQPAVTRELLQSLEASEWTNLEVIVVDNGSKVNNCESLSIDFPWAKAIRSEVNLGFAGGNNLGIKHATGDYLFFVNNDTEIPVGTITDLVNALLENPKAGAINPMIYYFDHPELVQFAGYTPINAFTGRNNSLGYGQKLGLSADVHNTPFVHGAALMLKREVLDHIGLMPENYFLYYEELDWGQRIHNAGFEMLVSHRSKILHKESVSTGKASPLKTYFQTRNRILFMRRNYHALQLTMFFIFFGVFTIPKSILKYVLSREWSHLKSFIEGVKWHFRYGIESHRIGYIYDALRA